MRLPKDFKIPNGFIDSTYENDTCPSIINEKLGIQVYIDDSNKERIYGLYLYNDNTDQYDHQFDTVSWRNIEAVINAASVEYNKEE